MDNKYHKGRKHCEQAISAFLTVFYSFTSIVRQNAVLCGNGLTPFSALFQ